MCFNKNAGTPAVMPAQGVLTPTQPVGSNPVVKNPDVAQAGGLNMKSSTRKRSTGGSTVGLVI